MPDILMHAAVKEHDRITELGSGSSGIDWSTPVTPQSTPGSGIGGSGGAVSDMCPLFVLCWKKDITPLAASRSNGFKVCDTSGYYRCGAGCNWCVPAGVDKVLFQVWAPGGGTSTNCCCGGAPFGPSGAFYMTEVNVVQGECYCLRAGCAYCCYAYQTTPGGDSEDSCIKNCSNNKFCLRVKAGYSCYCQWNIDATNGLGFTQSQSGAFLPSSNGQCSARMCSGWNFCFDTSNDQTCIPFVFSSCAWCVESNAQSGYGEPQNFGYGIPSIWPFMRLTPSLTDGSCSISPPIFGFENLTCKEVWNGNTCSGCCRCAAAGIQQGPSFGGYASQVYSGCQSCGGDSGGMGMVCVSWNCN